MILAICLIFLGVDVLLALGAMSNNLLNQKMSAAFQSQTIAFNTASAGIVAAQEQANGRNLDLSHLQGTLDYHITANVMDDCQQHTLTILSAASYQHAKVTLTSAYLKAREPPLPGCPLISHQLWWRQVDS